MTTKDKAIKEFAKAMKNADVEFMARQTYQKLFTMNMHSAWLKFIEACQQEVQDGGK